MLPFSYAPSVKQPLKSLECIEKQLLHVSIKYDLDDLFFRHSFV